MIKTGTNNFEKILFYNYNFTFDFSRKKTIENKI